MFFQWHMIFTARNKENKALQSLSSMKHGADLQQEWEENGEYRHGCTDALRRGSTYTKRLINAITIRRGEFIPFLHDCLYAITCYGYFLSCYESSECQIVLFFL